MHRRSNAAELPIQDTRAGGPAPREVRAAGRSGLADAVDQVAAAARPAVLGVDGAQRLQRLLVAWRELEHLAVHGGGARAQLRAAVELAQRQVRLRGVGCLAD